MASIPKVITSTYYKQRRPVDARFIEGKKRKKKKRAYLVTPLHPQKIKKASKNHHYLTNFEN